MVSRIITVKRIVKQLLSCVYCNLGFRRRKSLKRHLKIKRNKDDTEIMECDVDVVVKLESIESEHLIEKYVHYVC